MSVRFRLTVETTDEAAGPVQRSLLSIANRFGQGFGRSMLTRTDYEHDHDGYRLEKRRKTIKKWRQHRRRS